jgi:DNA-binding PadR family transcriptional regulator
MVYVRTTALLRCRAERIQDVGVWLVTTTKLTLMDRAGWPRNRDTMCRPAVPYVRIYRMEDVRITLAVAQVLSEFLDDVTTPRYGYELMQRTGFDSGKIYPILARLERAGWLVRRSEEVDPTKVGRPVRRHYRLTAEGASAARLELAHLRQGLAGSSWRPGAGRLAGEAP